MKYQENLTKWGFRSQKNTTLGYNILPYAESDDRAAYVNHFVGPIHTKYKSSGISNGFTGGVAATRLPSVVPNIKSAYLSLHMGGSRLSSGVLSLLLSGNLVLVKSLPPAGIVSQKQENLIKNNLFSTLADISTTKTNTILLHQVLGYPRLKTKLNQYSYTNAVQIVDLVTSPAINTTTKAPLLIMGVKSDYLAKKHSYLAELRSNVQKVSKPLRCATVAAIRFKVIGKISGMRVADSFNYGIIETVTKYSKTLAWGFRTRAIVLTKVLNVLNTLGNIRIINLKKILNAEKLNFMGLTGKEVLYFEVGIKRKRSFFAAPEKEKIGELVHIGIVTVMDTKKTKIINKIYPYNKISLRHLDWGNLLLDAGGTLISLSGLVKRQDKSFKES